MRGEGIPRGRREKGNEKEGVGEEREPIGGEGDSWVGYGHKGWGREKYGAGEWVIEK